MVSTHFTSSSPCPDVFNYYHDGSGWYGIVEASNPPPVGTDIRLNIRLSVSAFLPTKFSGKIVFDEDELSVLHRIKHNWPIRYKIVFPITHPLPNVVSITFDDRKICSGPAAQGRILTTISLDHILKSWDESIEGFENSAVDTKKIDHFNSFAASNNINEAVQSDNIDVRGKPPIEEIRLRDNTCGKTSRLSHPLIHSGEETSRKEWPWMVAIYKKKQPTSYNSPSCFKFICAGTLISSKLVVTAAHCMIKPNLEVISPQELILRFGASDLMNWSEESSEIKTATSIRINPGFNISSVLIHDIAVVKISEIASFTDFIRPVCLWGGDVDQRLVYDKFAFVIGWGEDENGFLITNELRKIKLPIVSTEKCRASNVYFHKTTSDTTLCAGAKDGRGPCKGDSGGGLFMKRGDSWTIRGIVSNSLVALETDCDLKEYVVYTDVAMYTSWIFSDH